MFKLLKVFVITIYTEYMFSLNWYLPHNVLLVVFCIHFEKSNDWDLTHLICKDINMKFGEIVRDTQNDFQT